METDRPAQTNNGDCQKKQRTPFKKISKWLFPDIPRQYPPIIHQGKLRSRIEFEDNLLNARTTIFLTTNGILLAAIGLAGLNPIRLWIALFGFSVAIVWLICGSQSQRAIRAATIVYTRDIAPDPIDLVIRRALWPPGFRSVSNVLGLTLPTIWVIGWVVFAIWLILNPGDQASPGFQGLKFQDVV